MKTMTNISSVTTEMALEQTVKSGSKYEDYDSTSNTYDNGKDFTRYIRARISISFACCIFGYKILVLLANSRVLYVWGLGVELPDYIECLLLSFFTSKFCLCARFYHH